MELVCRVSFVLALGTACCFQPSAVESLEPKGGRQPKPPVTEELVPVAVT